MALEQKLNLRMTQKLIMTPSLQQAIKLLQMTKLELQEEVTQELTENPLLEEQQDGSQEPDKPEGEEGPAAETAAPKHPQPAAEPVRLSSLAARHEHRTGEAEGDRPRHHRQPGRGRLSPGVARGHRG